MKNSNAEKSPKPKPDSPKRGKAEFKSLIELSDWIEKSLAELEIKFAHLKTANSQRVIIKR